MAEPHKYSPLEKVTLDEWVRVTREVDILIARVAELGSALYSAEAERDEAVGARDHVRNALETQSYDLVDTRARLDEMREGMLNTADHAKGMEAERDEANEALAACQSQGAGKVRALEVEKDRLREALLDHIHGGMTDDRWKETCALVWPDEGSSAEIQ